MTVKWKEAITSPSHRACPCPRDEKIQHIPAIYARCKAIEADYMG